MKIPIANNLAFKTVAAAMVLLLAGGYACADDKSLAMQFYPEELAEFSAAHPSLEESNETALLRVDLDGTGRPEYLVAVYSNGFESRLRLIRSQTNGSQLVAAPEEPVLFDRHPSIEAIDLDADGHPEMIVSLVSGRGRSSGRRSWIYRWNGTDLTWLAPRTEGGADDVPEELREPAFMDVDGDGDLEILEPSPTFGVAVEFATPEEAENAPAPVPDSSYRIWQVGATGLERSDTEVAYFGVFTRKNGKPRVETRTFAATPGEYVASIRSSAASTELNASEIRVNGETVVKPGAVAPDQNKVSKSIVLTSANTLSVELRGTPGSQMSVLVERRRSQ